MIKSFDYKVSEIIELTKDSFNLILKPLNETIKFEIGQYIAVETKFGRKPYSINSSNKDKKLKLCIKKVKNGKVSNYLYNLKKDDLVSIWGPYGKSFLLPKNLNEEFIFIATGSGIAPIIPMVETILKKTKKKVLLVYGNKNENNVIFKKELIDLSKEYLNFQIDFRLSSKKEYVYDNLEKLNLKDKLIYICGLREMVIQVSDLLLELGISKENIKTEKFF